MDTEACRTRQPASLSAGEVRIWAVLVVGVAYWANIVRASGGGGGLTFTAVVDSILDNGAFDVFAWAMVLFQCFADRDDRPATRRSVAATLLLGVIVLAPVRLAPALGLILLGRLLFSGPRTSATIRQMRLVLFALAFETAWVTSVAAPLHVLVAGVDARISAALLGLLGQAAAQHGNVVENVTTNFSIVIWPLCSSSFPLADVGLAFVAMVLYRGKAVRWPQLPWLALAFAGSIALTEIRLVLLAWNETSYHWWHAGPGMSVYALAMLGWAVAVPILATADRAAGAGHAIARPVA